MGSPDDFVQAVASKLTSDEVRSFLSRIFFDFVLTSVPQVSLFHTLMAKIPSKEVITPSQDRLFEVCANVVDSPDKVLPSSSFYAYLDHQYVLSDNCSSVQLHRLLPPAF